MSAQVQQYQTLDVIEQLLEPTERPYARLPQIVADSDFVVGPAGILHYGFDSEVVNFNRDVGVTGWRLICAPMPRCILRGRVTLCDPGSPTSSPSTR